MYVYVCVCMYAHHRSISCEKRSCLPACMYIYMYIYMYALPYFTSFDREKLNVCMHARVCICTYVCMYVCTRKNSRTTHGFHVNMHRQCFSYIHIHAYLKHARLCLSARAGTDPDWPGSCHVFVCVYIYICMFLCMRRIDRLPTMYVCMYVCICVCICMHVCVILSRYACVILRIYVLCDVCVYVCIRMYICAIFVRHITYIYIYTHTNTYL